jgi:hypothetical protein
MRDSGTVNPLLWQERNAIEKVYFVVRRGQSSSHSHHTYAYVGEADFLRKELSAVSFAVQ